MSSRICRGSSRLLLLLLTCVLLAGCARIATLFNPAATPTRTIAPTQPAARPRVSPTSTLSATATPATSTGTVNVALLRVRQGPGTTQPIVTNVKQGDRLVILGRNPAGDWLNVRLPNGVTGWVAAQYVTVDGAASSQAVPTSVPETIVPVATRKGPPTGAAIAYLVSVVDGDTIDVWLDGVNERVRYIGIDTPERLQPGYEAATEANRAILGAGPIYLLQDISDRDQTEGGRLLRYVYLPDGTLVARELVARGWAQPVESPPDTFYAKEFRQLAVQAARQKLGFWAPKPPPDGAMPYGLTTNLAQVRKNPGAGFPVNEAVPKDTPLTVYGRTPQGDWLQVRTPTRAGGWIDSGFVQLNVPKEQVPVVEDAATTPTP